MLYGEHNWTQIPDLADKVAVVPLGSIEQHGHHLPLLTDTMTGAEIARVEELAEAGQARFFSAIVGSWSIVPGFTLMAYRCTLCSGDTIANPASLAKKTTKPISTGWAKH